MAYTPKPKLHVPGHRLSQSGAPYEWDGRKWYIVDGKVGKGLCTCGTPSPTLPNDQQRKTWHRKHREELVAELPSPDDPVAIVKAFKNDMVTARVKNDPKRGGELIVEISYDDLCRLVDVLQPADLEREDILRKRVAWWIRVDGLIPEESERKKRVRSVH